jgi:hypothetical protein
MSQNFTIVSKDFLAERNTNYAVATTLGPVTAQLPLVGELLPGESLYFVNVGSGQLTILSPDTTIDGSSSVTTDTNLGLIFLGSSWTAFGQPQAQTPAPVQAPVTRPVKPRTPVEDTIASSQQT